MTSLKRLRKLRVGRIRRGDGGGVVMVVGWRGHDARFGARIFVGGNGRRCCVLSGGRQCCRFSSGPSCSSLGTIRDIVARYVQGDDLNQSVAGKAEIPTGDRTEAELLLQGGF